ncbi:hypothetical protein RvY_12910 [Ramazzottius varieornatus]|uniref:Uncharacterized protein n=1 Tax=Ramazzottius varieornatus TaxID=947166 RepID=A0A1D1VL36_RAMVA|nr:hypothetical protein RvY_12910 [Ramazzottius varieornatus]
MGCTAATHRRGCTVTNSEQNPLVASFGAPVPAPSRANNILFVASGELSGFVLRELPPGSTGGIGWGIIGPSRGDISAMSSRIMSYRYNSELLSTYKAPRAELHQ